MKAAFRRGVPRLCLFFAGLILGLLLVVQLRAQNAGRPVLGDADWAFIVSDLVESNARLRLEIEALQAHLAGLQAVGGGGAVLQSLVDEVNALRVANGLIEVSGPGVEVAVNGPISVLDLQDLINELRNTGAEALALNSQRLVAWSAIGADGQDVTVDGRLVRPPYRLEAIGDAPTLEGALTRPGGVVSLLEQAKAGLSIRVARREKLTLPVHGQSRSFVFAKPIE